MIENQIKYDVCIIGSGPAGAFAASELSKDGKKVIILEAGNDRVDGSLKNIIDLEQSDISGDVNIGLSNQLAGTSNLWGGGLVRYNKIDFVVLTELHDGPLHVPNIDKQINPFTYKFGLNLIIPSVVINCPLGGLYG